MADLNYTDMARLQQSTLGTTRLTAALARKLAEYWSRETARMRALDLVASRQDADPLWPQEYKRAVALVQTLALQQVSEYTDAQQAEIWAAVKRYATEMDRWLNSSTMHTNYPSFAPSGFKWPGKPNIAGGTEVQGGGGGGGLLLLLLALMFSGKRRR
jgi:hypothetical protein